MATIRTFNPNPHNMPELRRALQMLRIQVPPSSYDQTDAPDSNDNITKGWRIGSTWIDASADIIYRCADNKETGGGAVWNRMVDLPVGDGGVAGPAKGILLGFNSTTGKWNNLPAGTNDEALIADSGETLGLKWGPLTAADSHPIDDTTGIVKDADDATRIVRFDAGSITTGNTRVITMADQAIDLTPNTGTYPAAAHASRHTDGTDDIRNATTTTIGQRGIAMFAVTDFDVTAGSVIIKRAGVSLFQGGTNADLSGTGGTSQVLQQSSSGANITVGQLAMADISDGAAITDFFNGTFVESFDAVVTASAGTITMSLEQSGTGDLTMRFSDGETTLDCTPAKTIALTAGASDAAPQGNFIYILQSGKVLVKSTSNWPSAEHIKVAYFLVPTANTVENAAAGNNFVYVNHNWNDHAMGTDSQGHMSHMSERQRRMGARWHSGCQGVATQDGLDLWVSVAVGVVYELHQHAFAALDSDTANGSDPILVSNDPDANFVIINSLNEITKHSDGSAIGNNKFLKFVLWGVANKGGEVSPMMLNLPSGEYNTANNADKDVNGFANFTIPTEFGVESSTGFLIAAFICKHSSGSGMEIQSTADLRGQNPLNVTGAGPGGGDVTAAAVLTDNAIVRGDGGAKGVQTSTATIADNGVMSIPGIGDGGLTNYDLRVGDVTTPDYGMIQFGNAVIGRTSYKAGNIDLDGAILIRNIGGPVTSEIEFCVTESTGNTCRFAIAKAAVGNATYNSRSMLIAGPAPADTDFVKVSYWQGQGIFDNLVCDTSGVGADLGVQNDLEVEGDIFTDSIKESTPGANITLGANLDFQEFKAIAMVADNGVGVPAAPTKGQWFLHTATGRTVLMMYDGSDWSPIISLGTMVLYVNGGTGSDDIDEGYSSGNPFATIQFAIDQIPGMFTGNVTIFIATGTYSENLTIQGKMPTGDFVIQFDGTGSLTTEETVSSATVAAGTGATQGTVTSVGDFAGDSYAGLLAKFVTDGDRRVIDSHTDDVLTLVGTAPSSTTQDVIVQDWGVVIDGAGNGSALAIEGGQKAVTFFSVEFTNSTSGVSTILVNEFCQLTLNRCHLIRSSGTSEALRVLTYAQATLETCYIGSLGTNEAGVFCEGAMTSERTKILKTSGTKIGVRATKGGVILPRAGTIVDGFLTGFNCDDSGQVNYFSPAADGYPRVRNHTTGINANRHGFAVVTANVQFAGNTADKAQDRASDGYID